MCGYYGSRTFLFVGTILMKIIALQGKSNTGKTTTLKMLIRLFLENNKYNLNPKYVKRYVLNKCNSDTGDVKCVFEYNGKRIGITTRGDTEKALARDFKNHFYKCDIIVCAVHTHGKTVEFIKNIDDCAIIHSKWFVLPEVEEKKEQLNSIQSDYLFKEVLGIFEVS